MLWASVRKKMCRFPSRNLPEHNWKSCNVSWSLHDWCSYDLSSLEKLDEKHGRAGRTKVPMVWTNETNVADAPGSSCSLSFFNLIQTSRVVRRKYASCFLWPVSFCIWKICVIPKSCNLSKRQMKGRQFNQFASKRHLILSRGQSSCT